MRREIRPLLSPEMIRKGRELAGIDQGRLAMLVGVSRRTAVAVEKELPEKVDPRRRAVLERIRTVFETEFHLVVDPARGSVERRHPRTEG